MRATKDSGRPRGRLRSRQQTEPRTALAAQLSAPLPHFLATESGGAGILLPRPWSRWPVVLACLLLLGVLNRLEVWRAAPYVAATGLMWLATVQSGVHGSIAGMLAGLLIAARPPRKETVEGAARRFRAFRESPMVDVGRSASLSLARAVSVMNGSRAYCTPGPVT